MAEAKGRFGNFVIPKADTVSLDIPRLFSHQRLTLPLTHANKRAETELTRPQQTRSEYARSY